ncbi:MAG TPA: DegT/DnrJ/EryC1/StrS family aminotransferase [Terriglobia bacterium]|jgi:dTDP-4-amino-4,6-dideoxygalactose transaminase
MHIPNIYYPAEDGELLVLQRALASGDLSGKGSLVTEYEMALRTCFHSPFAVGLSSGAAALTVALKTLGISEGDEVLLPATCPMCTVFPIQMTGARIRLCDIQENNFGLDLDDADGQIGPKTKAIIGVPMWGYPTPLRQLQNFARNRQIPLVLDLAHAHGSLFEGKHLSEYCDIACFSTHNIKVLSTGEGGFLLTPREDYFEKAVSYSRFGWLNGEDFGVNFKLGSVLAAVGLHRLGKLAENLAQRTRNARFICESLQNPNLFPLPVVEGGIPNYYHLILKVRKDNRRLLDYMGRKEIPSDVLRYNVQPVYRYPILRNLERSCQRADRLLRTITTVPVHPGLSRDHLDYIVESLNAFDADTD